MFAIPWNQLQSYWQANLGWDSIWMMPFWCLTSAVVPATASVSELWQLEDRISMAFPCLPDNWHRILPTLLGRCGDGSIPIDTFLVGWTSIYQLFWGSLGTRVLTHPHVWRLFQHLSTIWNCHTHRIHGAAIYGAPWIPSIYPQC